MYICEIPWYFHTLKKKGMVFSVLYIVSKCINIWTIVTRATMDRQTITIIIAAIVTVLCNDINWSSKLIFYYNTFYPIVQYMATADALFVKSRDAVLLLLIPREVNLAVLSLLFSNSSHRPCSPAFCKKIKIVAMRH